MELPLAIVYKTGCWDTSSPYSQETHEWPEVTPRRHSVEGAGMTPVFGSNYPQQRGIMVTVGGATAPM